MRGRAFAVAAMATVLVSVGATDRAAAMDETVVVPSRPLPVPKTVSPELQRLIGSPMNPSWDQHPASAEAWRALVKTYAADIETVLPALMAREKVTIRADRMNGVPVFWVEPETVPSENRDRILLNFHGGAYVFAPGKAGLRDAILLAGRGFRVLSVDYRMAPDAPYPAAIDDAEAFTNLLQLLGGALCASGERLLHALAVAVRLLHKPLHHGRKLCRLHRRALVGWGWAPSAERRGDCGNGGDASKEYGERQE